MRNTFTWTTGSKWLRDTVNIYPLPHSGTFRKKIVCTEKVYEIDNAETILWISSISLIISFNKVWELLFNFYKIHFNEESLDSPLPNIGFGDLPDTKFQSG